MNALMSSWPRRGSCSEYLSSMSGAAIWSMTARLTVLPQNSVNQRPTMALLSSCLLTESPPHELSCEDHRNRSMIWAKPYPRSLRAELRFLPCNRNCDRDGNDPEERRQSRVGAGEQLPVSPMSRSFPNSSARE